MKKYQTWPLFISYISLWTREDRRQLEMDTRQYTSIWPKSMLCQWTQRSKFTMWLFCFQCWRIWRKACCCWCPLHHPTPYYMWIVNFWLTKPIRINWYWRKHCSLKEIYPATIWFTQLVKIHIFSSKSEYFLKCLYSNFQTTLKLFTDVK